MGWVCIATLDTLWAYGVKLRWRSLRGEIVICDRYLWDAIVDLHVRFPELVRLGGLLSSSLRLLCPTPKLSVFLHLSEVSARRRQAAKDEPFPDNEETFVVRHAIYQSWSEHPRLFVVDAERSIDSIHEELVARVQEISP